MCGLVWAAYIFLGGILTQAVFGGDTDHGGTWHHLDDFNLVTGECTMQLVKSDIHNLCKPHSGGVEQWEYYTGLTYKRN